MTIKRVFTDTNLFLRYLTNDIPEQAQAFEAMLHEATQGSLVLVANALVIAEIVWTLESFYRLPRQEIQDKVLAMLNTPGLEIAEENLILQAILWYVEKNVDFIDAFNAAWMLDTGLDTICTFDRKHFARLSDIKVISPGETAGKNPALRLAR